MTKIINIVCIITICICLIALGCGMIIKCVLYPDTSIDAEPLNIEKVNINTATVEELKSLPLLSEQQCENIIEYRTKYGEFKNSWQLLKVEGIDKKIFTEIYKYVVI